MWIARWKTGRFGAPVLPVLIILAVLLGVLGTAFGYLRAGIGILMFAGIAYVGVRWIASAVESPPEPELADVGDYGLKYVCTMCGLELKVEVAARDKAPTHCMEPMVLVRVQDED
jgi:hypothetical protein